MRRVKRFNDFELTLQINNESFISPPRKAQRHWLINTATNEFCDNLQALQPLAERFVSGTEAFITHDRTQIQLADDEIMENWQVPLMEAMAKTLANTSGNVLEIGFGRGIASDFIQQNKISSHTIIECNDNVIERFQQWKTKYPNRDIQIKHGLWQDVLPSLAEYDAIFFHTYPLNENDYIEQIGNSSTFAEHFFEHAAAHLKRGGLFTYLSNEMDSLSRSHQRALFKYFKKIHIEIVDNLDLPENVQDAWWLNAMVVIHVIK